MIAIKILIIEDEILIAEHIKDYLLSFGYSQLFMAHNKKLALQAIELIEPDLILLDMHLQNPLDGIEIAKQIDQKGTPPYIFITANADMLIIQEAIETKAAAYLTKPLKKSDLYASIQIALKSITEPQDTFLIIKDNATTIKLVLQDILFIESNGNYINIHTYKEKIVVRNSLEWIESELPEQHFFRIHRSFIVNKRHLQRVTSKTAFVGENEIPISRTNLSKVLDYLKK